MERYHAIIIGFGKGGKTLAGKLAAAGKKVALIEKSDKMYGGTCINVGCIPSKSLVYSAGITLEKGDISFEEKAVLYNAAIMEKRRVTSMLRKKNFDKLNKLDLVTIYHGEGSFLSSTQIKVEPPGEGEAVVIEGEQIFINTGAMPVTLPIQGLEGNSKVYTSESLMDLESLPRRLIIVGGGYIGLEFASIYSGFGSEVTVLEGADRLLPREDQDIASEIRKALEEKGVSFLIGAALKSVEDNGETARLHITYNGIDQTLNAEAVLIAAGRKPNTEGLHVEKAGVELTNRGAVKTDEGLKTSVSNIWAMGDVAGGLQFTYVSLDDYRIVWSQLNAGHYNTSSIKRKNIPYSVFIEPSYSRVGMNEQEARNAGYDIKILKLPVAAIPKAQVLNKTKGLLKAVIDAKTNKILGAMFFCEESYEIINIIKLAMDLDADYTTLRDQIYTHPTMSEALNDLFEMN